MADVSQFNVLGDLINVKDAVARNVDISHAVVDILGDSNAYEFGDTGVLTDKYPSMTVHNRAVSGESLINGFSRQVSEVDATNPPDYIIVWIGNNDVRRGTLWGVPQLSVTTESGFQSETCFGELNRGLSSLKRNCPKAQIIGVIINKPTDLQWTKWRFFFGTMCEIYKKWNIPIVNLNDYLNISNFVSTQFTTFYKDTLHYNKLGCERIRDIICSAMSTGLNSSGYIDYNDVYVETTENIEDNPTKWIQFAGQFLQPFDADPLRCSWSGTREIINLSNTQQRIICTGTWYGDVNESVFEFFGIYRTYHNTAPKFYNTSNVDNAFMSPHMAMSVAGDVLPLLRKGLTLSINATLYGSCANLPAMSGDPSAINIVPCISSTEYMMAFAWAWNGSLWLGNAAYGESTIIWNQIGTTTQINAIADTEYDVLAIIREGKIFTCTGVITGSGKVTNLPSTPGKTPAWSISGTINANGFALITAVGYGGGLFIGQATSSDSSISWTMIHDAA